MVDGGGGGMSTTRSSRRGTLLAVEEGIIGKPHGEGFTQYLGLIDWHS